MAMVLAVIASSFIIFVAVNIDGFLIMTSRPASMDMYGANYSLHVNSSCPVDMGGLEVLEFRN